MKYLLVLSVVLIAVWVWRNNRQDERDSAARRAPPPKARQVPPPDIMVACLHCGTHLPQIEAVRGRGGDYCCAEHRQRHESQRP